MAEGELDLVTGVGVLVMVLEVVAEREPVLEREGVKEGVLVMVCVAVAGMLLEELGEPVGEREPVLEPLAVTVGVPVESGEPVPDRLGVPEGV